MLQNQGNFHMQGVLPDYETPSSLQAAPRLCWTMLYGTGNSSRDTLLCLNFELSSHFSNGF